MNSCISSIKFPLWILLSYSSVLSRCSPFKLILSSYYSLICSTLICTRTYILTSKTFPESSSIYISIIELYRRYSRVFCKQISWLNYILTLFKSFNMQTIHLKLLLELFNFLSKSNYQSSVSSSCLFRRNTD